MKYSVGYYFQGIDDNGCIIDGHKTIIVDESSIDYYRNAMGGHSFGVEFIKVNSIVEKGDKNE